MRYKCMSGCPDEAYPFQLTKDVEIFLCLKCADIARKKLSRQVILRKTAEKKEHEVSSAWDVGY